MQIDFDIQMHIYTINPHQALESEITVKTNEMITMNGEQL